jgi:hypothetical protein
MTFLSLNLRAQTDSLDVKKWNKNHIIGVEGLGKLFFYNIFYQFNLSKNKTNLGVGFGANYYTNHISPVIGNTLFINYAFGVNHKFVFEFGQSLLIQKEGFNNNFNGQVWEKPEAFQKFNTFSLGYNHDLGSTHLGFFLNCIMVYYYGFKYDYSGNLEKYKGISPYLGFGIYYKI